MKRKIETVVVFIIIIFYLISLFMFSDKVIEGIMFSIDIWKNNLIPSIFPFLVFSYIFINYGVSDVISEITKPFISNILRVNKECNYIIILSLLSGFPTSSKFINDSYENGDISLEDANYLLNFCFFSNPLFIIGTIGILLLGNKKLGVLILISHYLSNFIIAILTRKKKNNKDSINIRNGFYKMKEKISKSKPFASVLKESIFNAIDVLLLLFGIISIFVNINNIVFSIIDIDLLSKGIISGILEMTSGIRNISNLDILLNLKLSIIVSILSFGGISIHMQILSIVDSFKVNYKRFLFLRILSVISSVIILNIGLAICRC